MPSVGPSPFTPHSVWAGMLPTAWQRELEAMRTSKDNSFRSDPGSPIRGPFTGLRYFDPDIRYRVEAKLHEEPPRRLLLDRSGGDAVEYKRLGTFEFKLPTGPAKLALYEDPLGNLFLPFRDATSGKETYGAGRYLEPETHDGEGFELDFNRAYHPFCAYNEAYSCPMVPFENQLRISVLAGERL